jgi:hypothetical protein
MHPLMRDMSKRLQSYEKSIGAVSHRGFPYIYEILHPFGHIELTTNHSEKHACAEGPGGILYGQKENELWAKTVSMYFTHAYEN